MRERGADKVRMKRVENHLTSHFLSVLRQPTPSAVSLDDLRLIKRGLFFFACTPKPM